MREIYKMVVREGSWIDRVIQSVLAHPRRFRWASYYRSLKRIPKWSPVHGERSWKRINDRRCALIDLEVYMDPETGRAKRGPGRGPRQEIEFQALQAVDVKFAGDVVSQFVGTRHLALLRRRYPDAEERGERGAATEQGHGQDARATVVEGGARG